MSEIKEVRFFGAGKPEMIDIETIYTRLNNIEIENCELKSKIIEFEKSLENKNIVIIKFRDLMLQLGQRMALAENSLSLLESKLYWKNKND